MSPRSSRLRDCQRASAPRRTRPLFAERLEARELFNVDWRNPADALDVNGDQAIAPNDALTVINAINDRAPGPLPAQRQAGQPYYDVSGDGQLSADDVLRVINSLNAGIVGRRVLAANDLQRSATLTATVGQDAGVRFYRLRLDGAPSATGGIAVYLEDPANPAIALLDSGPPGSPLFQLTSAGASFPAGYVAWDGSVLTLALPAFAGRNTGQLRVEYLGGQSDDEHRITLIPLSSSVDATKAWPPFAATSLGLTGHLAPASDPNGNGVVLVPEVTVEGQTAAGATVKLTGSGHALETTADASGRYAFAITVTPGDNALQVEARESSGRQATLDLTVRFADVILDWNATLLNIVRDWNTLSNDPYPNRIVLSPPPVVARNLAMVHAAMYDAVNAVERTHQPYQADFVAPTGTSAAVAAAAAAQRVATRLYTKPDEVAIFNAALTEALNSVPDGSAKTQGLAVGVQVGDAILAWRTGDGAATARAYAPAAGPGVWQRTFPDYFPPLLPQWPDVLPFAMDDVEQFRAPPPPALDSAEYAAAVDEVQRLGSYSSTERTTEQREIALFWADGGGTFTPPGHWNQIAADVALAQNASLAANARTFAMLNVAMADAGIASWDAKYHYGLWRPIAAIRQADTDGNPATSADPSWIPLLRTPNFPSYTSGHSTFSFAAAAVLSALFGENVAFSSRSDQFSGFEERPLAPHLALERSFTSFDQAAEEASKSRIYGGIHFGFDSTAGKLVGRAIGEHVVAGFFASSDEP